MLTLNTWLTGVQLVAEALEVDGDQVAEAAECARACKDNSILWEHQSGNAFGQPYRIRMAVRPALKTTLRIPPEASCGVVVAAIERAVAQ
jgi:hypothetical protein